MKKKLIYSIVILILLVTLIIEILGILTFVNDSKKEWIPTAYGFHGPYEWGLFGYTKIWTIYPIMIGALIINIFLSIALLKINNKKVKNAAIIISILFFICTFFTPVVENHVVVSKRISNRMYKNIYYITINNKEEKITHHSCY